MWKALSVVLFLSLVPYQASSVKSYLVEEWRVNVARNRNFFNPFVGQDGKLYLLEVALKSGKMTGPGKLTVLDGSGRKVREFQSDLLRLPTVGVNAEGEIYVPFFTGTGSSRRSLIRVLTPDFKPLRIIETPEMTTERILFDSHGNMYLIGLKGGSKEQLDGNIVHVYSRNGQFMVSFGTWDEALPIDERIDNAMDSALVIDEKAGEVILSRPNQFSPEVYDFQGRRKRTLKMSTSGGGEGELTVPGAQVRGLHYLGGRLIAEVGIRREKGSLLIFDSAHGSTSEVEIPRGFGKLIGIDQQGNFYFYSGRDKQIVKARLIDG